MSIGRSEASEALREIARAEAKSAEAYYGRGIAPFLFFWAAIWLIGYGAVALNPNWDSVWIVLGPLGGVASALIATLGGMTAAREGRWTSIWMFISICLFFFTAFPILSPLSGTQVGAFIPLVIGLIYTFIGVLPRMRRMLVLGVALMILTAGGYFLLHAYFSAWMAIVGSGALALGGLWIRRV